MEKLIMELHTEHKEWLNKLSFYKDDLQIMQNRLNEIVSRNTSKELMVNLEHFQNQLIIQHEQIDILKHEINEHEKAIEKSIIDNPVASDHRKMNDHTEYRDKMIRFEDLFHDLRKDLMSFVAKWM
jgi:hypothetical protein